MGIMSFWGMFKDQYKFLYMISDELSGSIRTILTSHVEILRVMTRASF